MLSESRERQVLSRHQEDAMALSECAKKDRHKTEFIEMSGGRHLNLLCSSPAQDPCLLRDI